MKIKEKEQPTKVIFKKVRSGEFKGSIDAYFPEMEANYGNIAVFDETSGHGEADLSYFWKLAPAKPSEYEHTKNTLERAYGYKLRVVQKLQGDEPPWRNR